MSDSNGANDRDNNLAGWDPENALASLVVERQLSMHEGEEEIARRLFREGLPVAAMAICHLSQHAPNERVRLDAAKYVVERNLGRIQDASPLSAEDPFEKLLAEIVREA